MTIYKLFHNLCKIYPMTNWKPIQYQKRNNNILKHFPGNNEWPSESQSNIKNVITIHKNTSLVITQTQVEMFKQNGYWIDQYIFSLKPCIICQSIYDCISSIISMRLINIWHFQLMDSLYGINLVGHHMYEGCLFIETIGLAYLWNV